MTALDQAFIKAYGRPRRGLTAKPATRPDVPSGIPFERGPALHRIDPAERTAVSDRPEPAASASLSAASLPSVEELYSHAVGIADVVDVGPPPLSLTVADSVAATAADLRSAWPARFASDARTLFDEPASPPAASAARPLSTFTPVVRHVEPVRPLLEVDRFEWPSPCQALYASSQAALDQFVSRLLSGAAEGLHRVALIGLNAAAGRTTVAMSLARRAAALGENWVLVDADFEKPDLAGRMGIVGQTGWPRVIAGERELGEVMIASLDDRLAIVPLESGRAVPGALFADARTAEMFDSLGESYGLVLIDAGSARGSGIERLASFHRSAHFDATYLVYDARTNSASDLAVCAKQLAAVGVRVTGAIENFASPSGDDSPSHS